MPKRIAKPENIGRPKKTASGYKFPEHIPTGFVIKDTKKQEWCIHETIGVGGFGEIYSACNAKQASKANSNYPYAVKIEPKENGPLYVEMHFYMRVAKEEDIEAWKEKKKIKSFGMPVLRGSGSFDYKTNSYRFLVTDKLGRNLQEILRENNNHFPLVTTLQIGVQVLNLLEYIHSKGYIHGDIKAGNMMLGLHPGPENTVYVIDFGLAAKCSESSIEYKKDPKRAQNGTIEYISRDGHTGVFGFRGDLEILGYNLLHWINGSLPWEKDIANAASVEQKKIDLMKNPSAYCKKHLPVVSKELIEYMEYIASLKNNDVPDYEYCRKLFTRKLSSLKCSSPYGQLIFTSASSASPKIVKKTAKGKISKNKVDPGVQLSNSSSKTTARSGRKRKSIVVVHPLPTEANKVEEEDEQLKNKKSRGKDYVQANSGDEDDTEDNVEAEGKRRQSFKRSSIKYTVKKKSPKINRRLKKLKLSENTLPTKISLNALNGESSSGTSLHSDEVENKVNNLQKGRRIKKVIVENKPSWKDAPSAIASNVKKAGEYVKNGSTSSKVSRKKK